MGSQHLMTRGSRGSKKGGKLPTCLTHGSKCDFGVKVPKFYAWTVHILSDLYKVLSYSLYFCFSAPWNCIPELEPLRRLWSYRWQCLPPPEMIFAHLFIWSQQNRGVFVDLYNAILRPHWIYTAIFQKCYFNSVLIKPM